VLFEAMLTNLRQTVTQVLSHLEIRVQPQQAQQVASAEAEPLAATGTDGPRPLPPRRPAATPRVAASGGAAVAPTGGDPDGWGKVPRNATCPCGSGKKYKHCHGRLH
jgi:preprotein translocase subunit SecA